MRQLLIIKAEREDLEKLANNSQHKKYNMRKIIFVLMAVCSFAGYAQKLDNMNTIIIDYDNPKKYEIGGIEVSGNDFTPTNIIILVSGYL